MRLLVASLIFLFSLAAQAMLAEMPLSDAAQEHRARQLFHAMKCVVCEGQSLADSHADFAIAMRNDIRRMVAQGDGDATIRAYFTARYGDRILMTPPLVARTALLWVGPALLLCIGGLLLWRSTRHPREDA